MKKKLKLNDLNIQSFVTGEADCVKGGTATELMTQFSCQAYISCNPLACVVSHGGPVCLENGIRINP